MYRMKIELCWNIFLVSKKVLRRVLLSATNESAGTSQGEKMDRFSIVIVFQENMV